MPAPVNRSQLRKEMHRSGFTGNISVDEAVSVVLRRTDEADYRLSIDDVELVAEANETQNILQTEFDQTQLDIIKVETAVKATTSAVGTNTAAVNATTAAVGTNTTAVNGTTSAVNTVKSAVDQVRTSAVTKSNEEQAILLRMETLLTTMVSILNDIKTNTTPEEA